MWIFCSGDSGLLWFLHNFVSFLYRGLRRAATRLRIRLYRFESSINSSPLHIDHFTLDSIYLFSLELSS